MFPTPFLFPIQVSAYWRTRLKSRRDCGTRPPAARTFSSVSCEKARRGNREYSAYLDRLLCSEAVILKDHGLDYDTLRSCLRARSTAG